MSRVTKILIAVAGVAVIGVAVVLLTSAGEATANEVRFQSVADPGPKPFTAPADVPTASSSASSQGGGASSSPSPITGSVPAAGAQRPGAAALATHCDREKLIAEVLADSGKLEPWADVVGIDADPQAVSAFVRKLHPVALTQDTQVTDHSFDGGEARAFQAILPKGTPVLANDDGEPVVRCRSGNPLTEPVRLETATRCINCPANYQPSTTIVQGRPCNGTCFKPDPQAPPANKPTDPPPITKTDPIATAKTAFEACRRDKGGLDQCKVEYASARSQCAKNPFNPLCDSTICHNFLGAGLDGCPSYIEDADIQNFCRNSQQRQACVDIWGKRQALCAANSAAPGCMIDPNSKVQIFAANCRFDAARPECVVVQATCAKDLTQPNCKDLRDTCTNKPERPDCKGFKDLQVACLQDKTKPECQSVPGLPTAAAPTLDGEQPDDQQEGQTTTPEEGGGEEGGGETPGGGGQEPDSGGTPQESAPPQSETP